MKQYHHLINKTLASGIHKPDRTGTGTISIFGHQMRFDLSKGFPLVTTKKLHFKSIAHELLWFLSGDTNIKYLQENGVRIWNEWADEDGNLGKVYGHQWRNFNDDGIDQISQVIESIKTNPNSRRHIVTAWNPSQLDQMALPPCHSFFQFYVADGKLSCQLYQRSADILLGAPFNIASYAMLTMMIAKVCDLEYGEFIHTIGDAHIYVNHIQQCHLQVSRELRPLPTLEFPKKDSIFDYQFNDFTLVGYDPHPHIKGKVAV